METIKWSKESLSAKLYRWFYVLDKLPQNLCPYFWKTVLMYIFIVPYTLVTLPVIILEFFGEGRMFESQYVNILLSILTYGTLFAIFSIGTFISYLLFIDTTPQEGTFWYTITITGGVLLFIVCVILLSFLISKTYNYIKRLLRERRYGSLKHDSFQPRKTMIKEFIKAKYNKYCPKIDWTDGE